MNILMISHYAGGPRYGMEFRSFYMGREWAKMGHRVLIVGATYSHLRIEQPCAGSETIEGVEYLWLPCNQYEGNGVGRVVSMFRFVGEVYRKIDSLIDFAPDIVIASSVYTFDIYPCRLIAKRAQKKHAKKVHLVYEVHDLWPLSPMVIGGYKPYHPFIWALQRGENYAYKHVDKVVSMLDKSFPHMQQHGLTADRFCCVPNGYLKEEWDHIDDISIPDTHRQLFEKLHNEGKIIIGFAGGHTASTAMDILIKAAGKLRQHTDIAYVLVGKGPQKDELIALAKQLDLANVFFLPPVEKSQIPQIIRNFDICYEGGIHSILHQYGTSANKMIDYMLSAKPIIKSVDEPGSEVERLGCGIQVEAENVKQVSKAILTITSMSAAERTAMGEKGRVYATEKLSYETLSQDFIKYIIS